MRCHVSCDNGDVCGDADAETEAETDSDAGC